MFFAALAVPVLWTAVVETAATAATGYVVVEFVRGLDEGSGKDEDE